MGERQQLDGVIKVYQVLLGKIPEYLVSCIKSVESFCTRSEFEYVPVTEIPDDLRCVPNWGSEFFRLRLIKDWISLQILSSQCNVLFIDWDIYLYESFEFSYKSLPVFASYPMECMMFNSECIDLFKRFYELAGDPSKIIPGELLLSKVINKHILEKPDFKYLNFKNETFMHLDNCRLAQQ